MPNFGEAARVRALEAPVANFKERVMLWAIGDEADVVWSGFWQGQLDRGGIALLEGAGEGLEGVAVVDGSGPDGDLGNGRAEGAKAVRGRQSVTGGQASSEAREKRADRVEVATP